MKTQLEITLDTSDLDNLTGSAPLFFCSYKGEPYRACLLLDEDGKVSTDTRAPWDRGTPIDEWHGRRRIWKVPAGVRGYALCDVLSDTHILELLQRVHNGHSVEWNGNNYVGALNDDAEEASDELERCLNDLATWDVWSVGDWLSQTRINDNLWPAGKNLEQVVDDLEADARYNDVLIAEGAEDIADMLCQKLLEQLEADDAFTLTVEQREALLRNHASRLADIEAERAEAVDNTAED